MSIAEDKIWYILIDGEKEGPYNIRDLKRHFRVTPDTLVWREGFKSWMALRNIPELKEVFQDEEPIEGAPQKKGVPETEGEIAIAVGSEPPSILFWLLIVLIILLYVLYQISQR